MKKLSATPAFLTAILGMGSCAAPRAVESTVKKTSIRHEAAPTADELLKKLFRNAAIAVAGISDATKKESTGFLNFSPGNERNTHEISSELNQQPESVQQEFANKFSNAMDTLKNSSSEEEVDKTLTLLCEGTSLSSYKEWSIPKQTRLKKDFLDCFTEIQKQFFFKPTPDHNAKLGRVR
jgi:hypothetical protein